ncbi:glycosyltransferase family 4 protein [Candidatus Bipolaricaulota bacterium]|nr:glycosyltransferase family 4 protein [Candidatus Bipolaricaulota bacterium]
MNEEGVRQAKRRLRVLYVEEGLSHPARHLLPLLASEVDYYLVTAERDREFADRYSMPIYAFPSPKFPVQRAWTSRRLAARVLQETKVDLIHSHSGTDFLLPRTVPVVTHVHGSWQADWRRAWSAASPAKKMRHLVGFLHYVVPESISTRRATHIITVSEAVKREVIRFYGIPPQRVTVVPNAVPEHVYNIGYAKRPEDPPRLVYVGRLHPSKGIAEVTAAFARAPELEVEFLIIGDGPERKFLHSLAGRDPRIRLLGTLPHEEVLRWLDRTNIFIFPSHYEGSSLALLEAMATGHACIVRKIPVMEEVLGQEVGILCNDVEAMVEAVADLVSDSEKRFEMQRQAKIRAREFSWQKSAHILMDVYNKVAEGACGSG